MANPEEIRKELHTVSKNVELILGILESNPKFKKEGLVEQVNRLDDSVEKLSNKFDMMWFKLTWIAAGAGLSGQIVWFILSKIFNIKI